jgi:hypothetical protein
MEEEPQSMLQNELQDTDVPLASEVDIAHDTTQID